MDATGLANSGDHPALNFLNTRLHPWGVKIDLLESGSSYLDWLLSAGLIDRADRSRLKASLSSEKLEGLASEARELRESLRTVIAHWAKEGRLPRPATVRLNQLLAQDATYAKLQATPTGQVIAQIYRAWDHPAQLTALPATAAANLFTSVAPELVRVCDGPYCGLWFHDRTRAHRRRWCSQAVCGNRDKVRNHRARAQASRP